MRSVSSTLIPARYGCHGRLQSDWKHKQCKPRQIAWNRIRCKMLKKHEKTFGKTPLHCWTFRKVTVQRVWVCEILWDGLCQRFPPQIPSPKLPSSSPVSLKFREYVLQKKNTKRTWKWLFHILCVGNRFIRFHWQCFVFPLHCEEKTKGYPQQQQLHEKVNKSLSEWCLKAAWDKPR